MQQRLTNRCESADGGALQEAYAFLAHKWTLLVLGALAHGPRRHGEVQRQVVGISPKMLTQTLQKLVQYNLATRTVYPQVPPRVEYTLTAFGESTAEPITAVLAWYTRWETEILAGVQPKAA
ncbi:winged helix-turn-helix transcriptional regulator [Hymenobacter psoromatis]|uniref:winged helix-turn-helix transcriptional regulator n=1 Tax=Hymenobacter psoromatis TaxID=1484116 RepID=UPI001CC0463B|nr:helix-turn-helix domain-containing protein [Hymenobacter psoromatis]